MDPIKIFLSYVSEDYLQVKGVYDNLRKTGFVPWMDKENILGGEDWEKSILRSVYNSDFIVVFLSENSVNKRGFFQREVLLALKQWEYKLEDDIFLIPIKLDNCNVPENIKKFQWIDTSLENWFDKFILSIQNGASRIGKAITHDSSLMIEEKKNIQALLNRDFIYSINVEYPSFRTAYNDLIDEVNRIICGKVIDVITRVVGDVEISETEEPQTEVTDPSNSEDLYINYNIEYISKKLASIRFIITSYASGMVHPLHNIFTLNFDLCKAQLLSIKDLFRNDINYLNFLSSYCLKELIMQLEKEGEIYFSEEGLASKKDQLNLLESGTAPEENNFLNFCLNQDGIIILFNEYTLGPYSWGQRRVELPYSKLIDILNNQIIKEEFLKTNNLK